MSSSSMLEQDLTHIRDYLATTHKEVLQCKQLIAMLDGSKHRWKRARSVLISTEECIPISQGFLVNVSALSRHGFCLDDFEVFCDLVYELFALLGEDVTAFHTLRRKTNTLLVTPESNCERQVGYGKFRVQYVPPTSTTLRSALFQSAYA